MKCYIHRYATIVFFALQFISYTSVRGQDGLIQHLDAGIEASISTDDNGYVISWIDQSPNGNDALTTLGSVLKHSENGIHWLDFGESRNSMRLFSNSASDSWLDQSAGTSGFCVIISFKAVDIHDSWNDLIGNSSAVSTGYGMRFNSSGSIQVYLGGTTLGGPAVASGESMVMAFNYNASENSYEFWDSKSKSTLSGTMNHADFSTDEAVNLGSTNNAARYFKGYIGELKIFNSTLSNENFIQEQDAFFEKWIAADNESEAPKPDPATFSIDPQAAGSSIISMTATAGYDENGPVEYLFTETSGNPGGSNSNWQTNPNFRDGDLTPETSYSYTVKMRDAYGNEGEASQVLSAVTQAYIEPGLENELEYAAYYGYQGWHFAEGDGRIHANDWVHWFEGGIADAAHIHGDMWPDLREYDPDNLYETMMVYPDGETAKLYSCFDYSSIDLHIKWMSDYGIKGCAVQRFTSSIDKANKLEQGDKKIRDVMTACEKYGVKFWIMHDSGQGDEEEYDRITNDWKHLVDDLDILQSPAYTWQDGKPVYGLWGMGVNSRSWSPQQAMDLVTFFHHGEAKYRTYICAGVPVIWRSDPPAGWSSVYDSLDMISPWRTIFNDPEKFKTRMQADFEYCNEKGIDYNPVVSPGASTLHLRDKPEMRNWKPRDGGHFLWKQAYEVCNMGSKFMYVAMFDEVDEGTAMYKLTETAEGLPIGAEQVALNEDGYSLPSDWYLQLGNEIQKMIEGTTAVTPILPLNEDTYTATPILSGVLNAYPIPAHNNLYVSFSEVPTAYILMNIQGVVLNTGTLNGQPIAIHNLEPGIYFLKIGDQVQRFIKN